MLEIIMISILLLLAVIIICMSSENIFVSGQIIKEDQNKNEFRNNITQIYPTKPTAEVYRFNNSQPNDFIQVNETEDPTVFSKKKSR